MTANTRILLGVILCATTVYSLQCFTCSNENTNANCLTATNCSGSAAYCRTQVIRGGVGAISVTTITKSCESFCTSSSSGFGLGSATISCCSTDLCNRSGGASITSSYAAIILALGSVLTILKSSVM